MKDLSSSLVAVYVSANARPEKRYIDAIFPIAKADHIDLGVSQQR